MLEVVISLIFVFLLYSLLATTIMELLAGALALRGKNLKKAIKNMLASDSDTRRRVDLFDSFEKNAMYQQLQGRHFGKKSPPSYLSADKFKSILLDVLSEKSEGFSLKDQIAQLPDGNFKRVMQQLQEEANYDFHNFKAAVDSWYNDVMDRASGWYKRNIQVILIILGLGIAAVFNVDIIDVYGSLSSNPELAATIADAAEEYVKTEEQLLASGMDSLTVKEQMRELAKQHTASLEEKNLGIGWDEVNIYQMDIWAWAYKVFGWFITALGISLGAPFWFDLLRKLVNVRSAGKAPEVVKVETVVHDNRKSGGQGGPVG